MLKFYYATQSSSTAARIGLEEAGLPYEGIEVSWRRKVNLEEVKKVNPLGQIPVLMADFGVLTQNIAILEYAADQVPEKGLLPKAGTPEGWQARAWLSYMAADFQKAFGPFAFADRFTKNETAQGEIREAAREAIAGHVAYVNQSLEGKAYLLGSRFSMVDAYAFVVLGWCKWAEINLASYKNILPYLHRIYERPAVQKVLKEEDLLDFFPAE